MLFSHFIIGTCLGSFGLWLCQQLVRSEQRDWMRRSCCPHCQHVLSTKDLIPIVAFITHKAQCAYCYTSISWVYFWSEFFAGMLAMVWCYLDLSFSWIGIFFILFLMSGCDLLEGWVPDKLQWLLLLFCLWCVKKTLVYPFFPLINGLCVFLSFIFILFFRPHWIGGADIKLFTTLSLTLPSLYIPWLLFIASMSALIYLALHFLVSRQNIKTVRFIPFITLSYVLLLLYVH